jgi:peroxiredoxin
LADFQSSIKGFESEQIRLIAGSVDPVDKARETAEKSGITYPVAYGMDVEEISEITGAFYDNERKYLHATGYLIRPDNTIEVACYSTGPIGRFAAKDILMLVKYYKSRK